MFKKKWIEIFFTSNQEQFFRAKMILEENNIDYKTDIINNGLRLAMNHDGRNVALGRNGVNNYYKIMVRLEDEHKAKRRLSGIR